MSSFLPILFVVGGIILFFIFLYFVPVNLWITAIFSGVRVGLLELVFMRIRKVPPSIIVNSLITATKAGLTMKAFSALLDNRVEKFCFYGGVTIVILFA